MHTQSLEADVKRLRGDVDSKAMELLEMKTRHQGLVDSNLAEGRRENALAMELERLKGELEVQKQELGRRREENDRSEAANTTLRVRVDELSDKTRDQARGLADYEARLHHAKQALVDAAKVHDENVKRVEAERDRELSLLKQNLQQIEYDLGKRKDSAEADCRSKVLLLEKDLAMARSEGAHYNELLAETTRQLEKSRDALDVAKLEAPKTAAAHGREIDALQLGHQKEIAAVKAQLDEEKAKAKAAHEQAELRLTRTTEDHNLLKCDHARVVEQNRSLMAANVELKDEVRQLGQVAAERDLQLTSERGHRTQADTVSSSQLAQIADLTQQLQKKDMEIQELLKAVQQQVDVASAANQKRNDLESVLREAEHVLHTEKSRSEVNDKHRNAELEAVQGKLVTCETQLRDALQKMRAMEEIVEEQKRAYTEMLGERRDEHHTIIEPLREKVSRQREDIHVLKEKAAVLEAQLDVHAERAQEASREASEAKLAKSALEEEHAAQSAKMVELRKTLDHITAECEEKEKGRAAAERATAEVEEKVKQLAEEKDDAVQRLVDSAGRAYDEQLTLTHAMEDACRRLEDTRTQLTAELELAQQQLRDVREEITELKEMNAVLKDTCARHEQEAESMQKTMVVDRSSPSNAATTFSADAQKWRRVSMELEAAQQGAKEMQEVIAKLHDSVAEEKRRCEVLQKDLKVKGEEVTLLNKQVLASGEEALTAHYTIKAALASSVYLLATVLTKLHGFVADVAAVGAAAVDVAPVAAAPAAADRWREDPGVYDADEAQTLVMKLLQCLSRCIEALKMHTGKASMNNPSPYTSVKSRQ
eukprot:TRINITY_DN7616_c0_g1_i2.p1 TRINITY_DN7616_c0_g1~~TRINITY_DN7616_c0_g1_i2.p1  ORF type:complete len:824 (+),score=272.08 TRINITY_DN7616_c0_g1_i2:1561-4032(+)